MMFPMVEFSPIGLCEANKCLSKWGHLMGPLNRPNGYNKPHGLIHEGELVAVTIASQTVAATVGGIDGLTRENTVELSRLCAARPALCRVALRLWREFVFPTMPFDWAISYQDADAHTGNTYRFDGWQRASFSKSGTDQRSGRKGRRKWVWVWPHIPKEMIR